MIDSRYRSQVDLLLTVLPEVAKEEVFALHGGTAINLFVRDLPRLSVDIDLTYIPTQDDRPTAFAKTNQALLSIKTRIEKILHKAIVVHTSPDTAPKLTVSVSGNTLIKIEVNMVNRGLLGETVKMDLCQKAQEEFDAFCYMHIVPIEQLFAGKICAALDRQHPRDFFDIKGLVENEGITPQIKDATILTLLSSNRPLHELLAPQKKDQSEAMINQFEGMTETPFTYKDYERTREYLIETMNQSFISQDKEFMLGFYQLEPNWDIHDLSAFPSIQWKIKNLKIHKENSPDEYTNQIEELSKVLGMKKSQ